MSHDLRRALRHMPPEEVYDTLKEQGLLTGLVLRWFELNGSSDTTEDRWVICAQRVGQGDLLRPLRAPIQLVAVGTDLGSAMGVALTAAHAGHVGRAGPKPGPGSMWTPLWPRAYWRGFEQ